MRIEEMPGVRHESAALPWGALSSRLEERHDAGIFADAIGEQRIHLDEVAPGLQAAVAQEIAGVVEGKEIFSGRERRRRDFRILGEQLVIERRGRFFDPLQLEAFHCAEPRRRRFARKMAVQVHCDP